MSVLELTDDEYARAAEAARAADRAALQAAEPAQLSRFRPGDEFVLDASPVPEPIWGRGHEVLWSIGESLIVTGPTGVGKTTLVQQVLAGRLGIEEEVLGYPVEMERRGRVLYLAADRPAQIARALRRTFGEEHREILHEDLIVWPGPPPADLAKSPQMLTQMAYEAGARTVILDSLKDMAVGIASDEVGAGLNSAIQMTLAAGIDVAATHHQRKAGPDNKRPTSLSDVYGSTWLTAGAGSVIGLWGQAGDHLIELIHLKQPAEVVGPLQIEHDHVHARSQVTRGFDLLQALRHAPQGLTTTDVARMWLEKDKPTDNERRKAQRRLDNYVQLGHARRVDPQRGGQGGTQPARYFAMDATQEITP